MRAATTTRNGPVHRAKRRPPGRLDSHTKWTERRGPVIAAIEPLIETFWEQGRAGTRHVQEVFWTTMRRDKLLDRRINLDWIITTTTILGSAETYLLTTHVNDWTLDDYQHWLVTTLAQLAAPKTQDR